MRFGRRSAPSAPAASYGVLVGQRHLWLVLERPGTVSVRGVEVDVEVEEQHGHHGVRVDLVTLPVGAHDLLLDSRPLTGPPPAPAPAGASTLLERDDTSGRLRVVRHPALGASQHRVTVTGLRLLGEDVEVRLDGARDTTATLVDATDREVARLAVDPDGAVVVTPADLAGVGAGDLRLLVDGSPVRRRANALPGPGAGVPLPAVHAVGAETARARLRWSADATLLVRVHA